MMHKNREWTFPPEPTTLAEVVHKLIENSWTLCTGFRVGSLTLVNDSTSEDGAQEYAVIKGGRQIESLTVSWYASEAELLAELQNLEEGEGVDLGPVVVREHAFRENCHHCR